ncbi:hypothetical protein NKG05_07225 [Oerskovia sp. M15]
MDAQVEALAGEGLYSGGDDEEGSGDGRREQQPRSARSVDRGSGRVGGAVEDGWDVLGWICRDMRFSFGCRYGSRLPRGRRRVLDIPEM